jgi:hypothetical protein
VECEHLPELKKSALSCDASLLHDVPDDLGKIAWRVVKYWWTKHGLPYCMQKIEEENRLSFATAEGDGAFFWAEANCVILVTTYFCGVGS